MRHTAIRLLTSGLLASALVLGLAVTSANAAVTAQAQLGVAATCYGFTCHGHDPVKYGCSISSTTSTSDNLVTLWNRYSASCNANWARAQLSPVALLLGDSMEVQVSTTDSHGSFEYMCYPGPSDTGQLQEYCTGHYGGSSAAYTDMVDGTNLATATAYVFSGGTLIDVIDVQQ